MPDQSVHLTEVEHRVIVRLQPWAASLPATEQQRSPAFLPPGLRADVRLLNLNPFEWLVVSDTIDGPALYKRLRSHAAEHGIAAVDLSCALKVLSCEGAAARDVLRQGCSLDLHPLKFPPGRATRTLLAQLSVIIDCTDPTPRFDLYVGRSYFDYLNTWVHDAGLCYGTTATPLDSGA